jgi:transaldolase
VQRPLWASTGAKNPVYRDVLYVEELIGPNTVNTMPLTTLESFRDHGRVRLSVEEDIPKAQAIFATLAEAGIDFGHVTSQLQEEGVQKFIDSFDKLLQSIEGKRKLPQQ